MWREERIANRQPGTVDQIDAEGNLEIRLDSGRDVQFKIREHPHIDYGYAVTSHSSQGATTDRVLVHVDTEHAHENLINSRLAYVSVSRGRYDAQIYTNNAQSLSEELSREVSKRSALGTEHEVPGPDRTQGVEHMQHQPQNESHKQEYGYGIGRVVREYDRHAKSSSKSWGLLCSSLSCSTRSGALYTCSRGVFARK